MVFLVHELVQSATDILEELPAEAQHRLTPAPEKAGANKPEPLSGEEEPFADSERTALEYSLRSWVTYLLRRCATTYPASSPTP